MTSGEFPKEIKVKERELQDWCERNIQYIEDGLTFVDRWVVTGYGVVDTLAVDKDLNPVVIEYKSREGEDESALIQSMSYASWIDKNLDTVSQYIRKRKPEMKLDELGDVRIIIIAPSFSERTLSAAEMLGIDILLKRYIAFEHSKIGKWFYLETVFDSRTLTGKISMKAYTIDDHFVGSASKMRDLYNLLEGKVKEFGSDIEISARKRYIGFRRRYLFGVVKVFTSKLEIGVNLEGIKVPEDPRISEGWARGWSRLTHVITLANTHDLDELIISLLKESYNNS